MSSAISRNTTTPTLSPQQAANVAGTITSNVMAAAMQAMNEQPSGTTHSIENAAHLSKEAIHHEAALAGVDISDLALDTPAGISKATTRIKEGQDETLITFFHLIQSDILTDWFSTMDPEGTLSSIMNAEEESADKAAAMRAWIQENQANLDKVTVLEFFSRKLRAIPPEIDHFRNVTWLILRSNQIAALPETIGKLTKLATLELEHNQLTYLPASIGQLTQLTDFRLDKNLLTTLPETIGQLTKLQVLQLNRNKITHLPDSISGLEDLVHLSLEDNQLPEIPESVTKLKKLSWLYLGGNQITNIPDSISAMRKSLTRLHLERNNITSIPSAVWKLSELQSLDLTGNKLTMLPGNIIHLKKLEWLYIAGNRIATLPKEIGQLEKLTRLYASGNRLTAIPHSLGNCVQLEDLELQDNQIETVPDSLTGLSKSCRILLSHNRIASLSDAIMAMRIFIGGNPLAYTRQLALFQSHPALAALTQQYTHLSAKEAIDKVIAELKNQAEPVGVDISEFCLEYRVNIDRAIEAINTRKRDAPFILFFSLSLAQINKASYDLFCEKTNNKMSREAIQNWARFNHRIITSAKALTLPNRRISVLPPEVCVFAGLERLDLSGNTIKELPKKILDLEKLQHLDLTNNKITERSVAIIEELERRGVVVKLDGNPILNTE